MADAGGEASASPDRHRDVIDARLAVLDYGPKAAPTFRNSADRQAPIRRPPAQVALQASAYPRVPKSGFSQPLGRSGLLGVQSDETVARTVGLGRRVSQR